MTEDFVTFELSKKLQEKGLNFRTRYGYLPPIKIVHESFIYKDWSKLDGYPAATISQVLKWLREKKCVSVEPYASASGWRVTICRAYNQDRCDAGGGTCLKEEVIGYNDGGAFEKYEEAAIAGIEYVLDNLI